MRPVRIHGCLLIAISLLTHAPAQAQNHNQDRVQLALKNPPCQPTAQTSCGTETKIPPAVLKSPSALWAFITSPNTGYFERLTAASSAGKVLPASWIPKVLAAQNEIEKEEHLHAFGVQRYPISEVAPYLGLPRDRVGAGIKRNVLGHPFLVPEKWIDYPLTEEELQQSPWPFQVSRALAAVRASIIRDGDPKQNDAVILSFPCTDVETARLLVSLTTQVAASQEKTIQDKPYVPPEVFGAWLNVLKNPKTEAAHEHVSGMLDQASANWDCPGTGMIHCPMAEVVALEVLKKQDRYVIPQIPRFHEYPHTLFLAAARFVLSPEYRQHNSLQDQADDANVLYYLAGHTVRDPFPQHLAADNATYERAVKSFADRFKEWGSIFERNAEMERPLLEKTSKFLSKFTTCRAAPAPKRPLPAQK
ncbi:MAG: hypothetical protein WBQ08_23720 [Candidatus Sulfotelmatobacter sp.]